MMSTFPRPQYSNVSIDQCEVLIRFRYRKRVELSYLPASDTEKEAQNVGLLLLIQFLNVFEGSHLESKQVSIEKNWGSCANIW